MDKFKLFHHFRFKLHYHHCKMINTCSSNILHLRERGMFEDIFPDNSSDEIGNLLSRKSQHVYGGFDPTASSLHVGNLLVLMNLLHWQRAGHHVIALLGCATAQIGDPSGHDKDRAEQMPEVIQERACNIRENIETIFSNHEKYIWTKVPNATSLHPVRIVDNDEWYRNANVITFLSTIGKKFRMGSMLLKESVAKRLKSPQGMNLAEFSYQVFQANDWLHLFNTYDCKFQVGGKDQMGNIVAGHNLISRTCGLPVYGLTLPLITTETGDKFGKSAGNAVWLDDTLTSPFDFYQFFMRTEDSRVEYLLKLFTFLSLNDIEEVMDAQKRNPQERIAQRKLAEEVTLLVHGEKGLNAAKAATDVLYGRNAESFGKLSVNDLSNVLKNGTAVTLPWKEGCTVLQLAIDIPCFPSRNKASKAILAGGFYINMKKTTNPDEVLSRTTHILPNNATVVRVGKKTYWIVKWSS